MLRTSLHGAVGSCARSERRETLRSLAPASLMLAALALALSETARAQAIVHDEPPRAAGPSPTSAGSASRPVPDSAGAALAPTAPGAAIGSNAELLDYVRSLEARVEELEASRDRLETELERRPPAPGDPAFGELPGENWTDRIRLSGSASTGWFGGEDYGVYPDGSFQLWDARFFLEADLAHDVRQGDTVLVRDVGLLFEWDLVRIGSLTNRVGEFYVDFQGIADSSWLNAQVGRFQIPVGEGYLRYSRGTLDNPFITNPYGPPWWWDEGVRLYGSSADHRFGYVASVTAGESAFNGDSDDETLTTLKLFTNPTDWLHASVSAARSGQVGSLSSGSASGAVWFGEAWARSFGAGSSLTNYQEGAALADGPTQIDETWLLGGDLILDYKDLVRLWLGYGRYQIRSDGASVYDRQLEYWIAELLFEGRLVAPSLERFYLGLRGSGLGTTDADEGYLLDSRYASSVGWNMTDYWAYSSVLGYRLTPNLTLRLEYTRSMIDLTDGVTDAIHDAARDLDFVGVDLRLGF